MGLMIFPIRNLLGFLKNLVVELFFLTLNPSIMLGFEVLPRLVFAVLLNTLSLILLMVERNVEVFFLRFACVFPAFEFDRSCRGVFHLLCT